MPPTPDHVAFYPARVDACYVDGELVRSQQGDFYGGWITRDVIGPFKGGARPGSSSPRSRSRSSRRPRPPAGRTRHTP